MIRFTHADVIGPRGSPNSSERVVAAQQSLVPSDLARTFLIIPCSKSKDEFEGSAQGISITEALPAELAREFAVVRERVKHRIPFNERIIVPAILRYSGTLYQKGRYGLRALVESGCHIVILSGGYGAVLATEPIGVYNVALKPSWWPNQILERILLAYAKARSVESVRGFAAATNSYQKVLRGVQWRSAGIGDALLITPKAGAGGARKSPAAIGEAIEALSNGTLTSDWISSDGLVLNVHYQSNPVRSSS
jgi:hypothetical protein